MEYKKSAAWYRNLIFVIGVVATLAYRIIVVLNYYSPIAVQIAWYIGTIGFIWYFAHRYRVQNYHAKLIAEHHLDDKVCRNKLTPKDCEALQFVLSGIHSSKAQWNSIFIFIFSALALAYAVIIDLLKIL